MSLKNNIDLSRLPEHVAIIMDGNGRWAKKRGNQRIFGHQNAVAAVRDTIEASAELGIKYLTLYAFSTENWNRPKKEVDALMSLLVSTMNTEFDTLMKNNIRLKVIGDLVHLSPDILKGIHESMAKSACNTGLTIVIALSYGSRWEILEAVRQIAEDVEQKKLSPASITNEVFESYLVTANIPDPELLIRTSGEFRVSNFLLFQIAYTELYFTNVLWPDFRREDLYGAIIDFQKRERRFGKTGEQLKN